MSEKGRYCINCKKEIDENAIFCEFCGLRQMKVEDIKIEKEIPEKIEKEIPEKIEKEIPEKIEKKIPEKIEKKIPEKIEKKIPEKIEKKRKNTVLALLVLFIIVASTLGISTIILGVMHMRLEASYNTLREEYNELNENYYILTGDYNELNTDYDDLQTNYNNLSTEYQTLQGKYDDLQTNYNTLSTEYQTLQGKYDAVCAYIRTLILPAQYLVFAEAVRRYYIPLYLDGKSGKEYWKSFAEFSRDVILHDSKQENSFGVVSNAFSECLKYGDNTMYLANYCMSYTLDFCDTINYWGQDELAGADNLTIIDTVIQECIDNIDYEYDSDITLGQESFDWDYIKFSVETAFRTKGDCEDQAILAAAYLESCGFETIIAISHDPNHPTEGSFYHGSLLVHIEDIVTYNNLYSASLWHLGGVDPYYPNYTWCWLDPTWDVPFGTKPPWLDAYGGSISWDVLSIAICDIDGNIGETELQCILA